MIKKFGLGLLLLLVMGMSAGCGSNADKERIRSADEIAIEQKEKAEDAVEDVNEQTKQFEQNANQIEEE